MGLFETIADRRIREARADGLFDDLPGRGKPIADLHLERKPGWWAARTVKNERDKLAHEELLAELAAAKPSLWRLDHLDEVQAMVDDLNRKISAYNRTTTFVPVAELDQAEVASRWRRINRRSWAGR